MQQNSISREHKDASSRNNDDIKSAFFGIIVKCLMSPLGSSHKVSAIWGWMICAWAMKNSAMTFWGYEK